MRVSDILIAGWLGNVFFLSGKNKNIITLRKEEFLDGDNFDIDTQQRGNSSLSTSKY